MRTQIGGRDYNCIPSRSNNKFRQNQYKYQNTTISSKKQFFKLLKKWVLY